MIPADHIHFNDNGTAWWVLHRAYEAVGFSKRFDRPCDTCVSWGGRGMSFKNCRDCDGTGRHTFTIEVEPSNLGESLPGRTDLYPPDELPSQFRVSVAPGMVLRIISMSAACADDAPPLPFIISPVRRGEATVIAGYPDADHETVITLPPDAKPGMWAVKLNVLNS